MLDNPFTYGNPISEPNRFFGRKNEVDRVLGRLRNTEFESSSLIGERRIGKTSLLNYLQQASVRSTYGLDPGKYLFIYVNLQKVGQDITPLRFWQWLMKEMADYYQDAEVESMLKKLSLESTIDGLILTDLFSKLRKNGPRIVLLLDEFEHIAENQNFGPEFFNLL